MAVSGGSVDTVEGGAAEAAAATAERRGGGGAGCSRGRPCAAPFPRDGFASLSGLEEAGGSSLPPLVGVVMGVARSASSVSKTRSTQFRASGH